MYNCTYMKRSYENIQLATGDVYVVSIFQLSCFIFANSFQNCVIYMLKSFPAVNLFPIRNSSIGSYIAHLA